MSEQKTISVSAPSNIAFVKYWGKTGRQHPINPSVSMTLNKCKTQCTVTYHQADDFKLDNYLFEGQEHDKFKSRIEKYLNNIRDVCPILNQLNLSIETENTFPHSAGIASSASAFAAIGYALAQIEQGDDIDQRASFLARLGSGSACRSITGPYTIWGNHENDGGVDDHAVLLTGVHPSFEKVKDTILLIDTNEKKVSSSVGHSLMNDHPFKQNRIEQAVKNTNDIINAMRTGDWDTFGTVLEEEALTLHAMMMTSNPSFILLAPNSLMATDKIRAFRDETNLPLYFTIDAGPNIHLIYPKKHEIEIERFIESDLSSLCHNNQYIIDECGGGANVITK